MTLFTEGRLQTFERMMQDKLKELVAAILPDKVRHKSQERDL